MSQVTFGSLEKGALFTYNGKEYTKIDKIKVSCCRFTNAAELADPRKKVGIRDNESVQVLDK